MFMRRHSCMVRYSHECSEELKILGVVSPLPERERTGRGTEILRAQSRAVANADVEEG